MKITAGSVREMLRSRTPVRVEDPARREAAVAIVLVPLDDDDLEILFIKRAERPDDPWSGQMALPGGRRDESDASLSETAIRETAEETGIDLSQANLLGELDDLAPTTPVLPPVIVRPFVFCLDSRPQVVSSDEVALFVWASLSALPDSSADELVSVRGSDLTVPSYRVGTHIVWGMTYRIINEFLKLASRPDVGH